MRTARFSWRRLAQEAVPLFVATTLLSCERRPVEEPDQLTFLFPGPSAGGAFAELVGHFNAAIPKVRVSLGTTPGSVVVVSALQAKRGHIGIAQADVVYLAYRRGIEDSQYPHTALRGIAVLWVNTVQIVVRGDSTFRSIKDLQGKRIGVAISGSAGELFTRIVLDAYGMSYSDVRPEFQRFDEMASQLERGTLDAAIVVSSVLGAAVSRLNRTTGVRFLPIEPEVTASLRSRYPFVKPVVVPAQELPGQHEDVETVGADALLICHKDLSEEVVYQLTKEFFAALPQLAGSFAPAALVDPEQAPTTPIPLHPGAARYYRELEILR